MGASVIASGDASPVLKFSEHILDIMALTRARTGVLSMKIAWRWYSKNFPTEISEQLEYFSKRDTDQAHRSFGCLLRCSGHSYVGRSRSAGRRADADRKRTDFFEKLKTYKAQRRRGSTITPIGAAIGTKQRTNSCPSTPLDEPNHPAARVLAWEDQTWICNSTRDATRLDSQ